MSSKSKSGDPRVVAKINELIKELERVYLYFDEDKFWEVLNLDPAAASRLRNGKFKLSAHRISQIIEAFPQVSREWLEKGEGEILKKSVNPVQNINGANAQATQIIGDGQTTNNYIQPCGEEQTETSKLIDAHNTLIEQIRQLTAVIASQQETISRLVANNQ
ncbi:MAG: hypothetical protein MSH18_03700 [Bacteroidales bacterium]|nr:hypothetical protein [Bacteroidales bacterium]